MLANGDLIFVRDESDLGQAIQASTGNYGHVAIYLDGMIYHASGKAGVICQKLRDFLEPACLYDLYLYPKIDIQKVKKRANQHLGAPYNSSFTLMGKDSIVPSTSLRFYLFLKPPL